MITVKLEKDLGPPHEHCVFCGFVTLWWFEPNDVPVCGGCAKTVEAGDVPTKAEWVSQEFKPKYPRLVDEP